MANKKNKKIREKKNLIIDNLGDTVIIKNRSAIGGGILGAVLMIISVAVLFKLRGIWASPMFWVIFAFIFLSSVYWFLNAAFGKIVLNSPKMLITVYSPFKKEYKFKDVNYVDVKSEKPKDGRAVHAVCVYIGRGRRCVRIESFSSTQAMELAVLLRGMLDNAAMEYPEGNEEPFDSDKNEKKENGRA